MPPEVEEQVTTTPAAEPSYTPPEDDATARSESSTPEPKVEKKEEQVKESKIKLPASIKVPVKTGRFQARISDLVSQRDTAEREAQQLRERLSRMTGMPAKTEAAGEEATGAAKVKSTTPADGDLNPEDFDTYGDYVKAVVNQTMTQKEMASRSEQAKADYEKYKSEKMESFNKNAVPLIEEIGDSFMDAITDPNLPISEAMADAVLELDEMGPYTMLWLAAHKDEAAKIAHMNPRAATIAIGRLASQLDFEIKGGTGTVEGDTEVAQGQTPATTPQMPMVKVAPRPTPVPTPRGSTPASLDGTPSDKDDIQTWLKKETDRLRRKNPNARFYGAQ